MIEINLLPEELRKKRRTPSKLGISDVKIDSFLIIKIAVAAAAIIIAAQIAVFVWGGVCSVNFKKLEGDYNALLPKQKEAERVKAQMSTMSKKAASIDELMVKRFSWAKKLNDLSDSMTPGIWLAELDYEEKVIERQKAVITKTPKGAESAPATEKISQRFLVISGAASSMGEEGTALIGRFIQSLKDNPSFYSDFREIQLGNIKREKVEDQEVMTFQITCFFK